MVAEPREFGSYRLVRRLGIGGMAETFEAARRGTGGFEQRVCLKRVLPAFSDDPEFIDRFHEEARLAAHLRHSNIVGVTDFGEVRGVSYMALELVDGVDLRSLLRSVPKRRLPWEMVALIGLDLAHALEYAHRTVVHRDVSSANVLIGRDGEAKLADFGIAKAIGIDAATASKRVQGKVPYMAPEQIRGEPVDVRTDLFSLGVVLFEAAAGRRPFDGEHEIETMHRVVEGRRVALASLAPSLPNELASAIEGLLAHDPELRTPSATNLIEELAACAPPPGSRRELAALVEAQRGGPSTRMHVQARDRERDTELSRAPDIVGRVPDVEPERPSSARTFRRPSLAVLAIALAAALAVGAVALVHRNEPPQEAPSGEAAVGAAEAEPRLPWLEADGENESDDGTREAERREVRSGVQDETPAEPGGMVKKETLGIPPLEEDTPSSPVTPMRTHAPDGRGWVVVVVQPWGNVWIDGLWMGRAPVEARLDKGPHVVEVGRELPSMRRVVRVEPGAHAELELNLSD